MKSQRNKYALLRSFIMFLLCAINIYVMDFKVVNWIFGVVPFFILGTYHLYCFIRKK